MIHVAITSVNFDKSPEGICTGLLIRALLDFGFRVTLITSTKSRTDFQHQRLRYVVLDYKPREPRLLFKLLAKAQKEFYHPFYIWAQRAAKVNFDSNDIPDIFYGRAWPYSSLIPAYELSKLTGRPFIAHLSDPIPPPNQTEQKSYTAHLQKLINHASAVTFTNKETVDYQKQFTKIPMQKAFVLNHVAPAPSCLPQPTQHGNIFHTGAIGNRASVLNILLPAFKQLKEQHPDSTLNFVNPRRTEIEPAIKRFNMMNEVNILPFLEDINDAIKPANILLSMEPEVSNPIWTLTKTIHYLFTNRVILAITSKGSPTERILSEFPDNCVLVTEYSTEAVLAGLKTANLLRPSEESYTIRHKALLPYTSAHVAKQFEKICAQNKN